MKAKINTYLLVISIAALSGACKKQQIGILETGSFSDTTGTLKTAASFPIGFAIDYTPFMTNSAYSSTVAREGSSVTFGYQMKHGAVVKDDGSFTFTNTDALVNAASGAGLQIFGHVLGWHSNQNATYLKNFSGIVLPSATELVTNGGFENGLTGWTVFNSSGATITTGSGPNEVRTGSGSMKVINPTANPGNQYKVQVSSSPFPTTAGKQYIISYWVKAASAGGSIRLSTGPSNPQYQGDQTIGTTFQQVTWTITGSLASTTFLFDMGQVANTYYIDDASVKEVIAAPSGTQVAAKLDTALGSFINTMVTRYKDKVKAWDVVNELFADDGNIRNNSNTSKTPADVLVWSNYLGRDYALKAFRYANAADPNSLLFINDYNLESGSPKLDSVIAFVKELQAKGAKVDGIGTQMHISINTSYYAIDNMFKKLAATGLKVRISELDVRINPSDKLDITPTATASAYQAAMYKYVISSYIYNVPAAQRYGITIWGVDDATSWIITSQHKVDYPLLFDATFHKKPAYAGVLQGLKGK